MGMRRSGNFGGGSWLEGNLYIAVINLKIEVFLNKQQLMNCADSYSGIFVLS